MPSEMVTITLTAEERIVLTRWLEERHGQTSIHYRRMIQSLLSRLGAGE